MPAPHSRSERHTTLHPTARPCTVLSTLQAKRVLAWQLPPRAFLADWCGGLSLAEALGILAWLGLNACWLVSGLLGILGGATSGTWKDQLEA